MHRRSLVSVSVALLAAGFAVSACSAGGEPARSTVTEYVTAAEPGTPSTQTGITVINPSDLGKTPEQSASNSGSTDEPSTLVSEPAPSESPSEPPSQSSSTQPSAAPSTTDPSTTPDKKVDPLKASCTTLLDASDIKRTLGATVSSDQLRIVDVANADVKMTGRVKCYYGTDDLAKGRPLVVALAQYADAASAASQLATTVSSETNLGAKASTADVSGKTANILLRDGGFLIVQYDTWTMSIASEDGLVAEDTLPGGLKALATMVLGRVVNR